MLSTFYRLQNSNLLQSVIVQIRISVTLMGFDYNTVVWFWAGDNRTEYFGSKTEIDCFSGCVGNCYMWTYVKSSEMFSMEFKSASYCSVTLKSNEKVIN